jgi:NADP-dependent 3-hydroxy acid dehydrogenase YdfG
VVAASTIAHLVPKMTSAEGDGARRTWLVTGASRGLGRAFAEAALGAGDTVAATARDPSALADLVDGHPGRALALALDVTDRNRRFAVVDEAVALVDRLDVVVNCPGYGLHAPIEETTEEAGGVGFPLVGLYCASKYALEGSPRASRSRRRRSGSG